ncbi:hypothetical protein BDF19DRAFT_450501 [Syncephalis fuscata]|nr:hypothetical protein BDF19DRAFT_450501 [Syncephalis fuscata]
MIKCSLFINIRDGLCPFCFFFSTCQIVFRTTMSFQHYEDVCRSHLHLLEQWEASGRALAQKQASYPMASDENDELRLRHEIEAADHETKRWLNQAIQSWCHLAPLLYIAFLDYREASGNHLIMAQNELAKVSLGEQSCIIQDILSANEAGYVPRFQSLYLQLSRPPAGWPHHYFPIRLNERDPWNSFLFTFIELNNLVVHLECPIVGAMLQELTALRKRLCQTVLPASLKHVYAQDNIPVNVNGNYGKLFFIGNQHELDSIDFHVSQLQQKPNNVRRLRMAYQRRHIIAAIFDPVMRSLASSDPGIRPIWKEEFYGNLATFYNVENQAETFRFPFTPTLAIAIPYDVYRCPLAQRAGISYQGMARKEVGELGFYILEAVDDAQCDIQQAKSKFFVQMITAVCGQELVCGGLIDAQHTYKPFCMGILLTNTQVQFYLAARRLKVDSPFEIYHYASCDLYSVDNRGKHFNGSGLIQASVLFRNQVDMIRRHLQHFEATPSQQHAGENVNDGFHDYRTVVQRLLELSALPELKAGDFVRVGSRDSIISICSTEGEKEAVNDDMMIDDDRHRHSPLKMLAKKSSISLEKRIAQITGDAEELQTLVANYVKNNNLMARLVHIHMIDSAYVNAAKHKWRFLVEDNQGRQLYIRLSQHRVVRLEQLEVNVRLQRSNALHGRLTTIRHVGYLLGMQLIAADYIDQRYGFPQNPYELAHYIIELAKTLTIFHEEFGICYGNLKACRVLAVNVSGQLPAILLNNASTFCSVGVDNAGTGYVSDVLALGQLAQYHLQNENNRHVALDNLVQSMLTCVPKQQLPMRSIVSQLDGLMPQIYKQHITMEKPELTRLERQLSMHDILANMSSKSDSSLNIASCRHVRSMPLRKRASRLSAHSLSKEIKQPRFGESNIFCDN